MAKSKSKGTRSGRGASRKARPVAPAGPTLQSLHARVSALERHVQRVSGVDLGAAPEEARPIQFTMHADNAPHIANVTLQDMGETIVLTPNSPSKSSAPRPTGKTIVVGIDTYGDPGQRAVIDVTNVTPHSTPITTTTLEGASVSDAVKIDTSF